MPPLVCFAWKMHLSVFLTELTGCITLLVNSFWGSFSFAVNKPAKECFGRISKPRRHFLRKLHSTGGLMVLTRAK